MTDAGIGVAGPVTGPAETAGPVLTVPRAPLAFHVMAMPTGANGSPPNPTCKTPPPPRRLSCPGASSPNPDPM